MGLPLVKMSLKPSRNAKVMEEMQYVQTIP